MPDQKQNGDGIESPAHGSFEVRFGISGEYEAPSEAYAVTEIGPGCRRGVSGQVLYHTAIRDAFPPAPESR